MLDSQQQIRFTQLWTDSQPSVQKYVASLIWNPSQTRDIVQNISLALLRKFSEYDEGRPFLNWALGVAKYEVLSHQRDAARNRIVCNTNFLDEYTKNWAEAAPEISDESLALRECVGQLKSRSKTIVKLRYIDGLNSESIANEIQISATNVRAILMRTRELLRRCIEGRLAVARRQS